jgi:hypothetical protein
MLVRKTRDSGETLSRFCEAVTSSQAFRLSDVALASALSPVMYTFSNTLLSTKCCTSNFLRVTFCVPALWRNGTY